MRSNVNTATTSDTLKISVTRNTDIAVSARKECISRKKLVKRNRNLPERRKRRRNVKYNMNLTKKN